MNIYSKRQVVHRACYTMHVKISNSQILYKLLKYIKFSWFIQLYWYFVFVFVFWVFFFICFTLLFGTGFCTTQLFEIWAQEVIVEYFLKEKNEIWYNADRPGTPFNFKIALTVAGSPEFYSRKPLEGWCGFTKEYDNSISGGNRWKLWDLFPSFRPW